MTRARDSRGRFVSGGGGGSGVAAGKVTKKKKHRRAKSPAVKRKIVRVDELFSDVPAAPSTSSSLVSMTQHRRPGQCVLVSRRPKNYREPACEEIRVALTKAVKTHENGTRETPLAPAYDCTLGSSSSGQKPPQRTKRCRSRSISSSSSKKKRSRSRSSSKRGKKKSKKVTISLSTIKWIS